MASLLVGVFGKDERTSRSFRLLVLRKVTEMCLLVRGGLTFSDHILDALAVDMAVLLIKSDTERNVCHLS